MNKSNLSRLLVLFFALTILNLCHKSSTEELISYVNVFCGTDGPGNVYPGAQTPFGMVQLSPDNGIGGWDRIAGYFYPDTTIAGFSHTHLSGTGAGDKYDLLFMPTNSKFRESLTPEADFRPFSFFSHDSEFAFPGYYSVMLSSFGIKAELTSTNRVGYQRYTFPEDEKSMITLDLGYALNWDNPTDTYIKVESDRKISGYRKSKGWAPDQRVYFVAEFSKPFANYNLYMNNEELFSKVEAKSKKTKIELIYPTSFNDDIEIKVAISNSSIEGARKNMKAEAENIDFDQALKLATQLWEKELKKVTITGTKEQKELFYTNLYRTMSAPILHTDVDGMCKGADDEIHKMDFERYDVFSLWDTYRAAHPLYTIMQPDRTVDMIKSFLAHYDECGLLPIWTMGGNETNMMMGYHAVPVIVDAYVKGFRDFDVEKAFNACVASAMEDGHQIDLYKEYGYVPYDIEAHWSVSKTLEYAYDDWCIYKFAEMLGKNDEAAKFKKRSENWRNVLDPTTQFFRPKDSVGNFIADFIPEEYTEYFCESNAWQYYFNVPQNISGLIESIGGKARFEERLDSMFTYTNNSIELPIFSTGMFGQYAHGNEPSHHVAYLYNYCNNPRKTQELTHRIINNNYSTAPDGYCGNEDCGQMSAWMVLSSLGFYPVNPASGLFDITSPWVESALLDMGNGKTFKMATVNFSEKNKYIDKIELNGVQYDKLTLSFADMKAGGEIVFYMTK